MLQFYNQSKVLLYAEQFQNKKVVFAEIHPSLACNHKCVWCRYGHDNSQLSYSQMLDIPKNNPYVKGIRITGGGEPLLNKELPEIMKFYTDMGLSIGLETNGGLLRNGLIDVIAKNCTYCRISLDAGKAKTHELLHQSKDFGYILDSVRALRLAGVKELGISFLVVPENVQEIPYLLDLGLPVDYYHFKPLITGIDPFTRNTALRILEHEAKVRNSRVLRFDRLDRDDTCNPGVPCYISRLITVLGGDGIEYVCCEKAYDRKFAKGEWQGDKYQCISCRYNGYNEILDDFVNNRFSKEFL